MNNLDRNLRFGWWSLLVFLSLGGVLEILHGFKIGWYVDVGSDMRRLMFTLAHAHGTALALVNIAAGLTARSVKGLTPRASVSFSLIWAGILFPIRLFVEATFIFQSLVEMHKSHIGIGFPFRVLDVALLGQSALRNFLLRVCKARTFNTPLLP